MVPAESLLVMSGADDGRLMSFLEQVDHALLSLHGSVLVEGLYSRSVMIEVGGQHCFGSVCEEERGEPYCNTLGVCHPLSNGFELKHDMLSGDEGVKIKSTRASSNLNLSNTPLLAYWPF